MAPLNEEEETTVGVGRRRKSSGESELGPEAMVRGSHTHTHIHMHTRIRTHIRMLAHPHTHARMLEHPHTHICMLAHAHTHTHTHIYRCWTKKVEKRHNSIPFQRKVVWNRNMNRNKLV